MSGLGSLSKSSSNFFQNNYETKHKSKNTMNLSPRSKEILSSLGLFEEDLVFMDFTSFMKRFSELQYLPPHTQKSSYDCYEKIRQQRQDDFNEIKRRIEEDPNFVLDKNSAINFNFKKTSHNSKISSTSNIVKETEKRIEEEIKFFENNKRKRENDIISLLKAKVESEKIRKLDEKHMAHAQEQKEIKNQIYEIRNEKEQKMKVIRTAKVQELSSTDEERKKIEEKHLDIQKKFRQELEKEKQRKKEMLEKELELKKRRDEEMLKIEKHNEEALKKSLENRKLMEEKEKHRQEYIKVKKEKIIRLSQEKSEKMKEKIDQTLRNLENKLTKQREDFEQRQRYIAERKEEIDKKIEQENKKRLLIRETKEEQKKKTIQKNCELQEEKEREMWAKFEQKNKKVTEINQMKENERIEKNEHANIVQFEKSQKIKQLTNIINFNKQKIMEKLVQKQERVDDFFSQKQSILEESKNKKKRIAYEKEQLNCVFERLLKKKDLDANFIEKIRQVMPDNPELENLIDYINEDKDENRSKTPNIVVSHHRKNNSMTSFENFQNKTGGNFGLKKGKNKNMNISLLNVTPETLRLKNPNEDPFRQKKKQLVQEYQTVLNNELMLLINKEKEKELQREVNLNKLNSNEEKIRLENIHNLERAKSYKIIKTLNSEIEKKTEDLVKSLSKL